MDECSLQQVAIYNILPILSQIPCPVATIYTVAHIMIRTAIGPEDLVVIDFLHCNLKIQKPFRNIQPVPVYILNNHLTSVQLTDQKQYVQQ